MQTASLSPVRRQQLQAESVRRCDSFPAQSYVLALLAEKGGQAYFPTAYCDLGDLAEAAYQLQQEGWLAVTGTCQNLLGQDVVQCTVV